MALLARHESVRGETVAGVKVLAVLRAVVVASSSAVQPVRPPERLSFARRVDADVAAAAR